MSYSTELKVGDQVAIRGDKDGGMKINHSTGKLVFWCRYFPEQLVDGKYVRHTNTGEAWTGTIEAIRGDMAKVAGGWRGIELLEVFP